MAKLKKKSVKKSVTTATKKVSVKKKPQASGETKKTVIKKTKSSVKVLPKKAAKKTKRKPETLMCFLTTACVKYYSLQDDGYELTTLRHYRDTYLSSTKEGRRLVEAYYQVSPPLVEKIELDKNKKSVYAYIYSEVKSSCAAIEHKKFELAKKLYTTMVKTLQKKYTVN